MCQRWLIQQNLCSYNNIDYIDLLTFHCQSHFYLLILGKMWTVVTLLESCHTLGDWQNVEQRPTHAGTLHPWSFHTGQRLVWVRLQDCHTNQRNRDTEIVLLPLCKHHWVSAIQVKVSNFLLLIQHSLILECLLHVLVNSSLTEE